MPRKRVDWTGTAERKRSPRGTYKDNQETRGKYGREAWVCRSFWIDNKMSQVETLTPDELEKYLDAWYEIYEARQIKRLGNRWWYDDNPKDKMIDFKKS